jgi:ABC-type branched-subunit amino acid transport system ATPase component
MTARWCEAPFLFFPRKLFQLRGIPVLDNDEYEGLSVQLETVRLNGVCTIILINTRLDTVHKVSENVAVLKSDNASFKSKINEVC